MSCRTCWNAEGNIKNKEGTEKKEQKQKYMDTLKLIKHFNDATERVVRETLEALNIMPRGKMFVCNGYA